MSKTAYYLRQQTRVSGPFTADELASMLRRGRVARSDKISVDKSTWIAIAEVPAISPPAVGSAGRSESGARADDGTEWFYTSRGAEQPNPVPTDALLRLITAGSVGRDDLVWRQGFVDWRAITAVEPFGPAVAAAATPAFPQVTEVAAIKSGGPVFDAFVGKRITAGVLALVCGTLGIHKFVLGLTRGGTTMLLLSMLIVPIPVLWIVAFAEGVLYLTKPDADFFQDYAVRKKQWL